MGLDELMRAQKSKKRLQQERDADPADIYDGEMRRLLIYLNSDKQYEESAYGGVIERGFHPSSILHGECKRRGVYKYLNVEIDDDVIGVVPALRKIFDNGHEVHDRLQRYATMMVRMKNPRMVLLGSWKCKGCGYVHSPDKEVAYPQGLVCPKCSSDRWKYNEFRLRNKKYRITGKRDGKFLIDGKLRVLWEIKSINGIQFSKLKGPLEKHIKQLMFYLWLDKQQTGKDAASIGLFTYECKNTQRDVLYTVELDMKKIKGEIRWLEQANSYIDNKQLPPKEPQNGCKDCEYKKTCKRAEDYVTLEQRYAPAPATKTKTKKEKR